MKMKRCCWSKKKWGSVLFSFGLGVVLALSMPLWGWRFFVGLLFIILGGWWCIKF